MKALAAGTAGVALGLAGAFAVKFDLPAMLKGDPSSCAQCHVMLPQYESWAHSTHQGRAQCADCHLPHENPVKYWVEKARAGAWDTWVFLTGFEPQTIRAKGLTEEIVYGNCLRCHEDALEHVQLFGEARGDCSRCHGEVAHPGPRGPAGTPNYWAKEVSR